MAFSLFARLLLIITLAIFCSPFLLCKTQHKQPKLVVVVVFDQFAHHYLNKLRQHFHYGIKHMLSCGIVYHNTYHPHGVPETTTGHHALSTGTLPKDHGGILNQWINDAYKKIPYDNNCSPAAAVLATAPHYKQCGRSPENTIADGLSDQFVLNAHHGTRHHVFALSLKSHPAIATANRMGKALWFDDVAGNFTSSKAYFDKLPAWVTDFNNQQKINALTSVRWQRAYSKNSKAYQFPDITNYDHAGYPFSLVTLPSIAIDRTKQAPYELFLKTPHAGKALFNLAKTCIDQNFTQANDRMLLWLSVSNLDLVGHFYGPDSLEVIDTLYHLDFQLLDFIRFVQRRLGQNNCLFVLTGDHGIPPIPELIKKRGTSFAQRIMTEPLITAMNQQIKELYNIDCIVKGFEPTFFTLNKEALAQCDRQTCRNIINHLKKFLLKYDGIKHVWTAQELEQSTFAPDQPENFYKMQLFYKRSGDLICMPKPYCLLTNYSTGTSHSTPYEYDTHVPLILYQKNRFEKKSVHRRVWTPQLPVTLAHILNVPHPSASMFSHLPNIEEKL